MMMMMMEGKLLVVMIDCCLTLLKFLAMMALDRVMVEELYLFAIKIIFRDGMRCVFNASACIPKDVQKKMGNS